MSFSTPSGGAGFVPPSVAPQTGLPGLPILGAGPGKKPNAQAASPTFLGGMSPNLGQLGSKTLLGS